MGSIQARRSSLTVKTQWLMYLLCCVMLCNIMGIIDEYTYAAFHPLLSFLLSPLSWFCHLGRKSNSMLRVNSHTLFWPIARGIYIWIWKKWCGVNFCVMAKSSWLPYTSKSYEEPCIWLKLVTFPPPWSVKYGPVSGCSMQTVRQDSIDK